MIEILLSCINKAEAFLTQSLIPIIGIVVGSKWMSEDLIHRAGSADKITH